MPVRKVSLPVQYRNITPKLDREEIKLVVDQNYTVQQLLDRRKTIEEAKDEARERAFKVASEEVAIIKMRPISQVGPEELIKISRDFIQRLQGEEVSIKYLAEKYRVYALDIEKYAQSKEWHRQRGAFQAKSRQASGARTVKSDLAEAQGGEIITKMEREAAEAMDASKQMNRSQRSTDRLIQIGRGRYKVAKALRITDEDMAIYRQNPKEIVTDTDNIVSDPVATKNLVSLVGAFKTLIELERDEDGWEPRRGKDGGLSQLEGQIEDRERLEVGYEEDEAFDFPEVKKIVAESMKEEPSEAESVFTD